MIPNDEVGATAALDIVRAVTTRTKMQNGASHLVIIGVRVLSVIGCSKHATERERGALKVLTQTDIEGNVGIVRMHVKPEVLV